MRNTTLNKTKSLLAVALSCFMLSACTKTDDKDNVLASGIGTIKVGIQKDIFEGFVNLEKSMSTIKHPLPISQKSSIRLNDDWQITAELTPEAAEPALKKQASTDASTATATAIEKSSLEKGTLYNLLVFDSQGNFVTENEYAHGFENSATALKLNGGQSYTFIAYSTNSKETLPEVAYANNIKNLSSATITVNGDQDLMYFSKSLQVEGDKETFLGVSLKHKLSQITTIIDATQTNYHITNIQSSINATREKLSLNLSDGVATAFGSSFPASVIFPTLPVLSTAKSQPTYINATPGNNYSYTIDKIKVGFTEKTNIRAFSNLTIMPGVKYNMKITISPGDDYFYIGELPKYPVVRIGDQVWMRVNWGANYNVEKLDAYENHNQLLGNYYQWGAKHAVANGGQTAVNVPWNPNNNPPNNAWNLGTEKDPIKNPENDPCPDGFRIPTTSELLILLSNLVQENRGPWSQDANGDINNYGAQKYFASKKNYNTKFIVPAQGFHAYDKETAFPFYKNSDTRQRAFIASFWTSTITGNNGIEGLAAKEHEVNIFNSGEIATNKLLSHNIRCIYSPEK